jgi:arylsulfatase A-like enzyme
MVMFDTLSRRFLPNYGCDWTIMPNFARLGRQAVTFDNSWVGSMPCMPARREIHTGRCNFLHRSWGPLEPWDDSMPVLLSQSGIYTHLASDHYHYWEEGGANYHTKYNTWECFRGQEGDPWIGQVKDPQMPPCYQGRRGPLWRQDWVNRPHMDTLDKMPQAQTMRAGCEFIERNKDQDNWFLHIETFDPHEPYFSPKRFKELYERDYIGPHWDWPDYGHFPEIEPAMRDHVRRMYAALATMCDDQLGRVLDMMDKHNLWKDTMLIVNTDHGTLLGEHDEWEKMRQPFYNEVANTPLFIWDPRCGLKEQRRGSLVQTIDLPATILELFGVERPADMQGVPLRDTIASDAPVREAGLMGIHGGHVNVVDGRYVYMRAPVRDDNRPLFQYTNMPAHMRNSFSLDEMRTMERHPGFSFTKGCPVMKISSPGSGSWSNAHQYGTLLFDIQADPQQMNPLQDKQAEQRMVRLLMNLMKANDAPPEQFERLGLC